MSSMSDEMARRIAEDGGAGLADDTGAAPGNEGVSDPTTPAQSAGTLNADTAGAGGPPDTIPYARFKEVNDRYQELRGYEVLAQYGYDPDSLGRLASFEASYLQDPLGVWKAMGDNLDLPQELKDTIESHLNALSSGSAEGEPSTTATTPTELPPEVQERLDYVDQMREREAEAERNAQIDRIVGHWDSLDREDKIETPKVMQLMAISSLAASGQQFQTEQQLAEAARRVIVDYRSHTLGEVVQRTGAEGTPRSLPGTAPVPSSPVRFRDIREATKAAEAAILRGELPTTIEG